MIDFKKLTQRVEDQLNSAIEGTRLYQQNAVENILPGVNFMFHIATETAEYKYPAVDDDNPNVVTEYICGVMKALPGATNTGYSKKDYIGSVPATLELLIPHCEIEDPITGDSIILSDVLDIIEHILSFNQSFEIEDEEIVYQITAAFSQPYASAREIRPEVGDSVVVTVQALYAVVANGLGPDNAKIAVSAVELPKESDEWEKVYTTQINFARATITDGNIFSDDVSGSSKCTFTGSRLVITVNGAVRGSYLDTAMLAYISTGIIPIFYIRLTLRENVSVHKMTFLETEVAIQVPSIPGCAYSLVEVV